MSNYHNIKKVSSSSLKWFEISPKYFNMMMNKEIEPENEFIFKKGKAVHYYILQPEEFKKLYTFLDYEIPKSQQQKDFCNKIARFRKGSKEEQLIRAYKECYLIKESDEKILEKAKTLSNQLKNYIKYIKTSTVKIVLSKTMTEKLENIKKEINNHRIANELLMNNKNFVFGNTEKLEIYNELEIYWTFQGIDCKSMLDRVIFDHENKTIKLIDIKTSSNFEEFVDKINEYKYYRQMTFYWLALYNYCKEKNINFDDYEKQTYIIAINMKEPTEIKIYKIREVTLNKGMNEIRTIFHHLLWHYEKNLWDYPQNYYEGNGIEEV